MHNIHYFDYELGANKTKIQKSLDDYAERRSDGGCGLPNRIEWTSKKFDSYEKAMEYIDSRHGWYEQIAVQYLDTDSAKKSAKALEIEKRVKELTDEFMTRKNTFHFKDVKSEYIGCKHCGSKISSKYLNSNFCPICHSDMRPPTALNRIENSRKKLKDAEKRLNDEIMKQKSKMKYRWLVKIEYHS